MVASRMGLITRGIGTRATSRKHIPLGLDASGPGEIARPPCPPPNDSTKRIANAFGIILYI